MTVVLTAALAFSLPATASRAQESLDSLVKQYLAAHPDQVSALVRDYVIKHPDIFHDVLVDATKNQSAVAAAAAPAPAAPVSAPPAVSDPTAAIKSNAVALFRSAHQVTLGNPNGNVTLVEFFDYNCGFCRGALPAMLALLKDDPKLRIVLKEWPILGPGSVEAAHVAVAVRMQDPGGQKYLAFHRKLLGDPGAADKDKALAAAAGAGLDMVRLKRDMDSDEPLVTIDEDSDLARALDINGTPGYVIGDTVVPGAVGLAALKDYIAKARVRAN
ncbi:MAG: DsbA family protein [Xanthobacteraceae bacterium]